MTDTFLMLARTALSPEWDHGFDEAFAELVSSDPDLVQAEFDALVDACWNEPPLPPPPSPAPPASSAARPVPPSEAANPEPAAAPSREAAPGHITDKQRSPP